MKNLLNILVSLSIFLTAIAASGQCDAASLNSASPVAADNSGVETVLLGIVSNEYVVLNGLIVNDSYTLTSFDLAAPSTEAFLTLRNTVDNSVIAFGYTPLTFQSTVTELEVHFFDESNCNPAFDLVQLSIQNESTLSIVEEELITASFYPNPVNEKLNIDSSIIITDVYIFNLEGKNVLKLNIKSKNFEVNLSKFESGLYFIKLKSDEGRYFTKRVIKK